MTRRRRLLLFGTGIALLVCTVFGTIYAVKRWHANAPVRAYERIEVGMTLAEVQALLPPGATEGYPAAMPAGETGLAQAGEFRPQFINGSRVYYQAPYSVYLLLEDQDRVMMKMLFVHGEPGWFTRLRQWLGI